MRITPEEQFVLLSSNLNPSQQKVEYLRSVFSNIKDWDYFTELAIKKQAAPLVLNVCNKHKTDFDIPSNSRLKLEQAWLKTLSRNMLYIKNFQDIVYAFNKENIAVIPLKGIYLADWLYKEIGLRQFSDMDVLIHPEDLEKAVNVLGGMGFATTGFQNIPDIVSKYTPFTHYAPLVRNGISIELHIRIHGQTESFSVDTSGLWTNATIQKVNEVEVLTFCLTDLLLHICLHLHKHFYISKFQFTGFYDVANIMNQYAETLDWDLFEKKCITSNAVEYTYKYILLAGKYLGSPVPAAIQNNYGYRLKKSDERQFVQCLRDKKPKINLSQGLRIRDLNHINTLSEKFKYVYLNVFPPLDFMIERYQIPKQHKITPYYFKRIGEGFKLIVSFFAGKIRK